MTSAFASQLRAIAANSTHELDLRARRSAHGESILFLRDVAVKQDFETIYVICLEGFKELCQLEGRFREFERTLFSAQSKDQDRDQMNKSENAELDLIVERCLRLLGSKVLLKPGLRAIEWLIRRFKIHINNHGALLLTFLPYHETPVWRNVISIIPQDKIVGDWKFLRPYMEGSQNVPRHALVYAACHNDGFFSVVNQNTLRTCEEGVEFPALMRFWGSTVVEAVAGRLGQTRSGRKEVQMQRTEDALLKILPIISSGFEVETSPDLILTCFTIAMVVAAKADLGDNALDSILQAVTGTIGVDGVDVDSALITISVILSRKQDLELPSSVLDTISEIPRLEEMLQAMVGTYPVLSFVQASVAAVFKPSKINKIVRKLPFLERMLRFGANLERPNPSSNLILPVLIKIVSLNAANESEDQLRSSLIELLQRLNEVERLASLISEAAASSGHDSTRLENMLGTPLALLEAPIKVDSNEMEVDIPVSLSDRANELLTTIPSRTTDVVSFLAGKDDHLFNQLSEAFQICSTHREHIDKFQQLPIWTSSTSPSLLICSFLVRIASSTSHAIQKVIALHILAKVVETQKDLDTQLILPYICCRLSDTVQNVRKAAAEVVLALDRQEIGDQKQCLGELEAYESSVTAGLTWITADHLRNVLQHVIVPNLEECILDRSRIGNVLTAALNGNDDHQNPKTHAGVSQLKKSVRSSLFEFLTTHAVATPLFRIKIELINLLGSVNKVGTNTKGKALLPVFETWLLMDESTAGAVVDAEGLKLVEVDQAITQLVIAQEKDALTSVLSRFVNGTVEMRPLLVSTLFERMAALWKVAKHADQLSAGELSFDLASSTNKVLAQAAQGLLQSVKIPSEILARLAELSTSNIVQMQSEIPPKKRRRTSHGRDSLRPDISHEVGAAIAKLTFVLELIENSEPEKRPELLPVLFDMLSTLKSLKHQRFESPYLMNLCLSSILAILETARLSPKSIDLSSVRVELVTECLRDSDNSQVQNTTLLLSAALASLVPDRMVHNIMPIFTFMGQSMFSKDDEHSVFVINQAIEQIVPALVSSLRKHSKNMTVSVSNLLASFTSAFDHVPSHRRVSFYQRLLMSMGNEDFAYITIAMLAVRKHGDATFMKFIDDLMEDFGPQAHLVTYLSLLKLVQEVFATQSVLTESLFGFNASTSVEDKKRIALLLLKAADQVSSSKTLRASISRMQKLDEPDAQALRQALTLALYQTLATIRERRQDGSEVILSVKQCLDALLELPSLAELLSLLPDMLHGIDDVNLKAQALRVLASQFEKHAVKNTRTQTAAIRFLSELTPLLTSTYGDSIKQAALTCVDRIAESYGRKNPDAVVEASSIILSSNILEVTEADNDSTSRTQIQALLCLATTFETLKQATVPLVPELMPKLVVILQHVSTAVTIISKDVYDAVLVLLTAVISHVSFMVSEDDLQDVFSKLNHSATTVSEDSLDSSGRKDLIRTIARKMDLDVLVRVLTNQFSKSASTDSFESLLETLDILSITIDSAAKSIVTRNASAISDLIQLYLDLRRIRQEADSSLTEDEMDNLQIKINDISIKYVYKLNDTVFRPIFETWTEWVDSPMPTSSSLASTIQKSLRQISLFKLLVHFFNTLKSIVTNYASYVLQPIVEILTHYSTLASAETIKSLTLTPHDAILYKSTMDLLISTFTHDADNFFSTLSHFTPLSEPLIAQLQLAASKSFRPLISSHVIPTIVSLATAVLDTPTHHHTLSKALTSLRRSSSPAIRLASITTMHALIDDEELGDDWIANVIGVGAGEGEGARGGGSSVGETMIYVNEMLEDDDEEVERSVRKWVGKIRERVGEDVFEI